MTTGNSGKASAIIGKVVVRCGRVVHDLWVTDRGYYTTGCERIVSPRVDHFYPVTGERRAPCPKCAKVRERMGL